MSSTTTKIDAVPDAEPKQTNGLSDEQIKEMLAAGGRRKNDPEYVQRLMEGAVDFRRKIQDETERELEQDVK